MCTIGFSCSVEYSPTGDPDAHMSNSELSDKEKIEGLDYFLPKIDLSNWKVTLPIADPKEVIPPAILEYGSQPVLTDFMYNDSTDGSLVFYTYPGITTPNSSYSRTELREQMVPGNDETNWKFSDGGTITGTLSVEDISKDQSGSPHRIIVMQIHGRLTEEQRLLIREDDHNAPPVLKIYWIDGKVQVRTKVLKDSNVSDIELLRTNSWKDDSGHTFSTEVGREKFSLSVSATEGKLTVILNDDEKVEYEGIDLQKWNVFENYFKAGNYLITHDPGAYSKVKYFTLDVSHP